VYVCQQPAKKREGEWEEGGGGRSEEE